MGLDLDFDLLLEKMDFVAARGISPVRTDPDLVYPKIVVSENRTTVKKLL